MENTKRSILKLSFLSAASFSLLCQCALADQLQCWRAEAPGTKVPFMTAEVLPELKIADVRFYQNTRWEALNVPGQIRGKIVRSHNSPYPNYVEYRDGIWLFLPKDLSSQNLAATARLAELNNKNSNAYLIVLNQEGEPRGIHMVCYSDIY